MRFLVITHCFLLAFSLLAQDAPKASPEQVEHFEKKVRPLLIAKCYSCHSEEKGKSKGSLKLDSLEALLKGGDHGPAVVPGKPSDSWLMKAVKHLEEDVKMPPAASGGKLKDEEIAALEKWILTGAAFPSANKLPMAADAGKNWWAFQPVPKLKDFAITSNSHPINHFMELKLKEKGIKPAGPATKTQLLRRVTFDLTGLPPTPVEMEAFLKDTSPTAWEKVIDRLLASPQYGEKWGRHWLDLVRYADSLDDRSYDKEGDILDAWRYRDWVVEALNSDLPYDQFITQQLAGDILNTTAPYDPKKIIATGMYAIGNWGNGDADKEKVHTDIVDDQIDVTGRAFLGLTVSCARCHDHKFDPISTRDYYALSGFFFSSHILVRFQSKGEGEKLMRIPLVSPEEKLQREEVAALEKKLAGYLQPLSKQTKDILGKKGLHAWSPAMAENPSLVVNTTEKEVAFISIKLGARCVSLHPGVKTPVTALWKSPVSGKLTITGSLRDADGTCGDGIEWALRLGEKPLQGGMMPNGGKVAIPVTVVDIEKGQTLQLIVKPAREYTCDTTEVEWKIQSEAGESWDFSKELSSGSIPNDKGPWFVAAGEGAGLASDNDDAKKLSQEIDSRKKQLGAQKFAQGMLEGGIAATGYAGFHDAKVHLRGSYTKLGELVPRGFPKVLTASSPTQYPGSGRLELAKWITSPSNPLTSRVMVNRIWQHHFGEGLVRTTNNFGKLGTPPSHPQLLDYLASKFIETGYSIKAMHRLVVTSKTYQRSAILGKQDAEQLQQDPDNLWLGRFPRRRLAAEEFRDAALFTSRELKLTLGGKAIKSIEAPRRTLYITTIRSDRSNYQALFDGADATGIVEKRTESTSAPQALWLLNHPFVQGRALKLAENVLPSATTFEGRVKGLFQILFQRDPSSSEVELAKKMVAEPEKTSGWLPLCRVLLCSNEFLYLD